jgi:hypothetical protein
VKVYNGENSNDTHRDIRRGIMGYRKMTSDEGLPFAIFKLDTTAFNVFQYETKLGQDLDKKLI